MKKLFFLILFLFFSFTSIAQTYTKKYNSINGRYEYFDSRGTMVGYEKYNSVYGRWDYYIVNNDNNPYNRKPIEVAPVQSNVNLDLIDRALKANQDRYDNQVIINRTQESKTVDNVQELAVNQMNRIISHYNNAKYYPTTIKNGWHIVYVMNNYDFCEQRKVYVDNNKVTKYIVDDWSYRDIEYTLPIQQGKTSIKLKEVPDEIADIYFLDAISNPSINAPPPTQPTVITLKKRGL